MTVQAAFDPVSSELSPSRSWLARGLPPALLAFALSMLMHVPVLGLTPLSGTEGLRALTGHQMVESHQWLVPMLFGRPYLAKPPLHYWLIAVAETLARRGNVFVWRLPSALAGSAVCAVVALLGTRWFCRTAGLIAGLSAAGMITFWGECQVADIDATNRLMATLAAACGVEMFFGRPGRKWPWALGAALAIGATLMTKGHTGLPIIAGVWIYAAFDAVARSRASSSRQPLRDLKLPIFWLPWVVGASILGAWGWAAHESMRRSGTPPDPTGLIEGARSLYAASPLHMLKALAVPPELFAYALPVSLALPLYFVAPIRRAMTEPARRIATALIWAVLVSWVIYFLAGVVNVRYTYPTLPLLCPLAGAVAVAAARAGGDAAEWLRRIVGGTAIMLLGAAIGLAFFAWGLPHAHLLLIVDIALAVACLPVIIMLLARSWRPAWGLVALALLASVPFSLQRDLARTATSGIVAAAVVRDITGPGAPLEFAMALQYKPEIFYYAGVNAKAMYPRDFRPANVPAGTWVFLSGSECQRWQRILGPRLTRITPIARTNEDDFFLAWYAK